MKILSFVQKVAFRSIFSIIIAGLIVAVGSLGVFSTVSTAQAATLSPSSVILAEANPVDQVFGAGTTDQVQGKVKKDIGTVEKAASNVKGQMQEAASNVEGAAQQAEGRAQQDIGRVKGRAEDAGSELEDASNDVGDAFKSLFGQ
ncbi:MAG: CsbD family protein [Cyanobacteriota bacterium]|nr:CsbD family protein [Cyanobacteriota bacterium]